LNNNWKGYHPVPYQGRGLNYYLGDNTGLVHTFVDSNNVINGQTYYYAVVAYDHGDSLGIPPSETSKKITVDPITGSESFDINTVKVIPGPRTSGYVAPGISSTDVQKLSGAGNGAVDFRIINDLEVIDDKYTLRFSDQLFLPDTVINKRNYSVRGEKSASESFYLFDTKFASLSREHIIDDEMLRVTDNAGNIYQKDVDYIINFERGRISRTESSSMPNNSQFNITYNFYSVYQSTAIKSEDSNPVFNGVKLTVFSFDTLGFDNVKSGWNNLSIPVSVGLPSIGAANRKKFFPGDYIITFADDSIGIAKKRQGATLIDIAVNYKVEEVSTGISIPVVTLLEEKAIVNNAWSRGDEMILFQPGAVGTFQDTLTWSITFARMTETDSVMPGNGDMYYFYSQRPFTINDVYTLQTKPGIVDDRLASSKLDNIYVVPNPYVGANVLEPANKLPGQNRGERRIYFENLPMKCTIRIYTLTGELVTTLEHDSGMDNGREYWNLLNKDGFSVAYGVYLAHIDAPGIGEKLVKFALIK
jgi:hypothetical protein